MTAQLTVARKADREIMALQVAELAGACGLTASPKPEEPGTRRTSVDIFAPHGLKLTVAFDANGANGPDVWVLSWHGVEGGICLDPLSFASVNPFHGHKATDIAYGWARLVDVLSRRFIDIMDGSAFIIEMSS